MKGPLPTATTTMQATNEATEGPPPRKKARPDRATTTRATNNRAATMRAAASRGALLNAPLSPPIHRATAASHAHASRPALGPSRLAVAAGKAAALAAGASAGASIDNGKEETTIDRGKEEATSDNEPNHGTTDSRGHASDGGVVQSPDSPSDSDSDSVRSEGTSDLSDGEGGKLSSSQLTTDDDDEDA